MEPSPTCHLPEGEERETSVEHGLALWAEPAVGYCSRRPRPSPMWGSRFVGARAVGPWVGEQEPLGKTPLGGKPSPKMTYLPTLPGCRGGCTAPPGPLVAGPPRPPSPAGVALRPSHPLPPLSPVLPVRGAPSPPALGSLPRPWSPAPVCPLPPVALSVPLTVPCTNPPPAAARAFALPLCLPPPPPPPPPRPRRRRCLCPSLAPAPPAAARAFAIPLHLPPPLPRLPPSLFYPPSPPLCLRALRPVLHGRRPLRGPLRGLRAPCPPRARLGQRDVAAAAA